MPANDIFDLEAAAASLPNLPAPVHRQRPEALERRLGDARLRFISDGAMSLPFRALGPEVSAEVLADAFGFPTPPVLGRGDLTALLIEIGSDLVLIDAGGGHAWQEGAGHLMAHLAANSVAPESVTALVLTHLHPDHAWGALTPTGDPAFPNARVIVGAQEANFWSEPDLEVIVRPAFRPTVIGAAHVLTRLAERLVKLREGDAVAPGLHILDTPGHSPGHISLLLETSSGPDLIITGDAVVNDQISFSHPDWAFGFDSDAPTAILSRRRLLEMAADGGHLMTGYHWSWPGLGHAERTGAAFRFVPSA